MSEGVYYRPSGRIGDPLGLAAAFGFVLVAGATAGWAYSWAAQVNPFIKLNFALAGLAGLAAGWGATMICELSKVRHRGLILAVAVLAGLGAEGGNLVGFARAMAARLDLPLPGGPGDVARVLGTVAEMGPWNLGDADVLLHPERGVQPHGDMVHLVWFGEALLIVGAATAFVLGTVGRRAFCEPCGEWVPAGPELGPYQPIPDPARLRQALEQGRLELLDALRASDEVRSDQRRYAILRVDACPGCQELHLLSIYNLRETGRQGEDKLEITTVLEHLLLDRPTGEALRRGLPVPRRRAPVAIRPASPAAPAAPAKPPAAPRTRSGSGGAIAFQCPHCRRTNRVPAAYAGREGLCPGCKKGVCVPGKALVG